MIDTLHAHHDNARRFWQAWRQQSARFAAYSPREFVEQGSGLLQQYFPPLALELLGDSDSGTIVLTAHACSEHFPAVQILAAEAPDDIKPRLQTFRNPIDNAEKFAIGFEDFHLAAADIRAKLDIVAEMPALTLAFAVPFPEEQRERAQHMALIMLDHILGEWASAVHLGNLQFGADIDEHFIPLPQLAPALQKLRRELNQNGDYPDPQNWKYATAHDETNRRIFIRNQSAAQLIGRADMCWNLSVICDVSAQENLESAYALQDALDAEAAVHHQGIPTLSMTDLRQGKRYAFVMTAEPQALFEKAKEICTRFAALNPEIRCEYDPRWQHYRW